MTGNNFNSKINTQYEKGCVVDEATRIYID